jgi:GT2 family glycosyltransferase
MIYFIQPYYPGNLGYGYNEHITGKYFPEDWICCMDFDTMILNNSILEKIYDYTKKYDHAGILTGYTNRIGGHQTQLLNNRVNESNNIIEHKYIADKMIKLPDSIKIINKPISGFFMLFKYKTFLDVGGFDDGIFVDGKFSQKVLEKGHQIMLMENIYIFHYYRLEKHINNKTHLQI